MAPGRFRFWTSPRSPVTRRAGWTVADQALSSIGNFAMGVILARSLDRGGFGAFSLGFAAYLLLVGVSRALSSSVLQVRFTAAPDQQRDAIRDSMGVPVLLSALAFGPLVVAGWLLGGSVGAALGALSIVLPGLLLQDAWRFAFFTTGRAHAAALNDLIWVVVQFAVLGVLVATTSVTVWSAMLVWGCGAYVAAGLGIVQCGAVPTLRGTVKWLSEHRDLGLPTLGEFVLISGTGPATLLLVGAMLGVEGAGTVRAAEIVLGPLNVLFTAGVLIAVPEAARLHASNPSRLPLILRRGGLAFAGVAVGFGAVGLVIPDSVGRALVGPNWSSARSILAPLAVHFAAVGILSAWLTGLRVLEAANEAFRLRLVLTPLYLVAVFIGTLLGGVFGAEVGNATASCIGAGLMQWRFHHCFRRNGAAS